ncbi:MAG: sulfatase [Planctomycetes bacterium]|nr:sulfatase [Planctomycetota bacterium]
MTRHFIYLIVSLAPLTSAWCGSKPNILFIFSDDHALRTISAYTQGKGINKTPSIDRIATEGAIFTRSYCTNSICQPSRASILTGKHSHKNGVLTNGSAWNSKQQIFPRLLKSAGYTTAMIGKWHMHPFPSNEFDYHKTLSGHGGQGRYFNPEFVNHQGNTVVEKGYSTDVITNESIEWMKKQSKDSPFLLMCQFKSPHTNVMPPVRNLKMYSDGDLPIPDSYHSNHSGRSSYLTKTWMKMNGMRAPHVLKTGPAKGTYSLSKKGKRKVAKKYETSLQYYGYMDPEDLDAYHAHYDPINAEYGRRLAAGEVSEKEKLERPYQLYVKDYLRCVAAVDQNVGRLLEYLDESGLAKNTIVVYASDQGFFLGENGWTDKRLMDDVTLSMPFVIRWPGVIAPGQRIDAMIQNIDYAPTFLEAAGLPIPSDIQGRSLLPFFKGKGPAQWRDSIYYHYYNSGDYNLPKIEGVRTSNHKLIRYYDHPRLKLGVHWELFDLNNDPNEQNSVFDSVEYAPVLRELQKELDSLRQSFEVK